jgi:hypothetical protein
MKKSVWIFLLLCFGCTHQPKQPAVHLTLINNNQSVEFKGLDYAITGEINRDSVPGIWQGLIPVYRMPADTDMKDYQKPLPGQYRLKDSAVVFTPDTPFVKNQTYFVRYFKFDGGNDSWDIIKGKKKLGKTAYTDLIFKQ